jgi:hypothetical protein
MMFQQYLSGSNLLLLPLIGLVLCFMAFVGVVVRLLVGLRHGETVDHLAALPLEEDVDAGAAAGTGRTRVR